MRGTNKQVLKAWRGQTTFEGRTPNGNLSFYGPVLYSYATPIANIVRGAAGQRVVLVTSETYSPTTSGKHMPRGDEAELDFCVPFIGVRGGRNRGDFDGLCPELHEGNLRHLAGEIDKEVERIVRGRHVPAYAARLFDLVTERARYVGAFGLPHADDRGAEWYWRDALEQRIAWHDPEARKARSAAAREANAAAREANAAAREAKAEARRTAEMEMRDRRRAVHAELQRWRQDEGYGVHNAGLLPVAAKVARDGAIRLSTGYSVATTGPGSVKFQRLYKWAAAALAKAFEAGPKPEGLIAAPPQSNVGPYCLPYVDAASGRVQVGCQSIPWHEVHGVAEALGVASPEGKALADHYGAIEARKLEELLA